MPAFVPALIGAGVGLGLGYVSDYLFGDGEYSGGEAFFDAAGGALGGAVLKPVGVMAGRVYTVGRAHASKATSFAISTVDDAVGAAASVVSGNIKPIGIGVATGILGDQYTRMKLQSSASRSERNASDVGAGGIPSSYRKPDQHFRKTSEGKKLKKITCPPGHELVEWKGKLFCRPEKARYPRSLGRVVRNSRRYSWKSM